MDLRCNLSDVHNLKFIIGLFDHFYIQSTIIFFQLAEQLFKGISDFQKKFIKFTRFSTTFKGILFCLQALLDVDLTCEATLH